jgi:hypothetical protein
MTDTLIMVAGPLYGYVATCTIIAVHMITPPQDVNERAGLVLVGLTWPIVIGSRLMCRLLR